MTHTATLRTAAALVDRAVALEARALRPGDTCSRRARQLRADAMRELQSVRGYSSRDVAPWPAEQLGMTQLLEEQQ